MTTWGLLGGSFDPPHMGHLLLGSWALATGEVDALLVVPCHVHALDKRATASFEDRWAMTVALCEAWPGRAEASDIERRLGDPSRTLRTLRALTNERPGDRFRLVVGQDILAETHRWHAWDEVVAAGPPLVAGRRGSPGPPQDIELPDVSSTEVRRRLAAGEDASALVPAAVARTVAARGLYR